MATKYLDKTIREIHIALMNGEVTSLDLVNEAIERINRDDCNSYEAKAFDKAIKKAKSIKKVDALDYLEGIPYLAKDNYSTKGIETTASSNILNGYVPLFDAEVIRRLSRAGAVMVAKTTLDELAMGGTGTSGHKGTTCNPYDHSRMIGGSSCGSAAAVAKGDAPFSLGSDTGDSVRKPASHAGLVGFKPTWGLISRYGLLPFACSMDTVGYFTRCVWDSALITSVLAGHDDKDMSSSRKPKKDYIGAVERKESLKRICYFKTVVDACAPYVQESFYKVLDELKERGYVVENYDFPIDLLDALYPTYMILSCSEATANDAQYDGMRYGPSGDESAKTYQEFMTSARTKGFSDLIKRRFVIGSYSLLAVNQHDLFQRAQKARRVIVNALNKMLESYDYFVLPASPFIPKHLNELSTKWDAKPEFADNHLSLANFGGMPSLTLPMGLEQNVPYGINISGRIFEDDKVLALGEEVEEITGLKNLHIKEEF